VDFEELFYKLDTQLINKKNSLFKIAEEKDKDSRVERENPHWTFRVPLF